MTRSATPNTTAIRRALRQLRRQDRLDELGQVLGVLLVTSAMLVDEATGPYSDCAAYARALVLKTHGGLVRQMDEHLSPVGGISPVDQFLASLMQPSRGGFDPSDDDGQGRFGP